MHKEDLFLSCCPRQHIYAFMLFAFLALVFFADVLFTDKSLSAFDSVLRSHPWRNEYTVNGVHQPILTDSSEAHYPQRKFEWSLARQGYDPKINPYIFTGMPWVGQGVGAFLTSFPQLFLDLKSAIDWSTCLRLILAGFFMYLLLRNLGISWLASCFGGLLWSYNLHQIVWLEFPQHLATQLWMPLVLLYNIRVLRSAYRMAECLKLLLVNVLFVTSGYTQIAFYTYIFIFLFNGFYFLICSDAAWRQRIFDWLRIHGLYVLAALIFGAGILLESSIIRDGLRAEQSFRTVSNLTLGWQLPLQLLHDMLPRLSEVERFYTPNYFGGIWSGRYHNPRGFIVGFAAYASIPGLFCFFLGLFARRPFNITNFQWLLLLLILLAFALYNKNPLALTLLNVLPHGDLGSTARFITPLLMFAILLAAVGMDLLRQQLIRRRLLLPGLLLVFLVSLPFLDAEQQENFNWAAMRYPLVYAAFFIAMGLLVLYRPRLGRFVIPVILCVTIADLFLASWRFNTRMPDSQIFPVNNSLRFLLSDDSDFRVAVVSRRPMYPSNVLSYYGIVEVGGYHTVLPRHYKRFIEATMPESYVSVNGILRILSANVNVLRNMNVKYILSDAIIDEPGIKRVLQSNGHYIYRIVDHLPRVFCATDVTAYASRDELFGRLNNAYLSRDRPVLLEGDIPIRSDGDCRIDDLRVQLSKTAFTFSSDAPQLVVLPYLYSPNWQVDVAASSLPVLRANGSFMAVQLPAGKHRVTLHYENALDVIASVVMILFCLTMLVLIWIFFKRPQAAFVAAILIAMMTRAAFSFSFIHAQEPVERHLPSPTPTVENQVAVNFPNRKQSPAVIAGKVFRQRITLAADSLVAIKFYLSSRQQQQVNSDVVIRIREIGRTHDIVKIFADSPIIEGTWLRIDLHELELGQGQATLEVEFASHNDVLDNAYSVWLGENKRLLYEADYKVDVSALQ